MTKFQLLLVVLVGALTIAAGLVWLFGPYGLIASGVGMVAVGLLAPVAKE